MKSVQDDLDQANVFAEKAKMALESISISQLRDLKGMKAPPQVVEMTFIAVLNLLCKYHPSVPINKHGQLKTDNPWKTTLSLIGNPQQFLDILGGFKDQVDQDLIPTRNYDSIRETLADERFRPENLMSTSPAVSQLCSWVINVTKY